MSKRARTEGAGRRWLIRSLLAVIVLFVLLWIVAAGGIGMGLVIPWALARAAPEGWTVHVGSAEGDWRRLVHLRELSLRGPDGELSVEALVLEYRLVPLLHRTLDLLRVEVSRPVLEGALPSGGAPSDLPADTPEGRSAIDRLLAGSPLGAWELRVASLRVDDGAAVLEGSDGTYRIERADLAGSATISPEVTRVTVDSLVVEAIPPTPSPDSAAPQPTAAGITAGSNQGDVSREVRFDLVAELEDGAVHVRSLRLRSARSHVDGAGDLLLASVAGYVHNVDFTLKAEPLDLRDLPFELPAGLADEPRVHARLTANGPPDAVALALEADGPGSLSARADGLIRFAEHESRAERADSSALRLDTRLSVDLSEWVTSPYAGEVTADVEIVLRALDSTSPVRARGTLVHSPPSGAPAGLLGGALRVDLDVTRAAAQQAVAAQDAGGRERTATLRASLDGALDDTQDTAQLTDVQIDATMVLHRPPVAPSSIEALPPDRDWVEIGALSAQLRGSRARWQVDLLLDSGSVEGTGAVSWAEDARELVVDELRLRRVDLSALTADMPATSIGGRVVGRVAGSSMTELVGRVAMSLDASTVGETTIDTAAVNADLVEGSVTGSAMIEADVGRVETEYRLLLGDSSIEATVTRLEGSARMDSATSDTETPVENAVAQVADGVDAVDGVEAPDSAAAPAWTVRGRASGSWALGDTRSATLSATLDTSTVAGMTVTDAVFEARLLEDSVTASVRADVAPVLSAPVTVTADAAGRGTGLGDATGLLRFDAARFHLSESDSTRSGMADSLSLAISATEPGNLVLDGQVRPAEGGVVILAGSANVLEDALSFALDARGTLDTPAELISGGTIQRVSLESSGARTTAGWSQLTAALLLTEGRWGSVVADTLSTNLRYDSTGVVLDTLALASNVITAAGSGLLPASRAGTGSIGLTARFDLEPLRGQTDSEVPTIGGNELAVTVSGTTDSVEVALSSSMTALVHRDVRVSGLEGEATALFRPPFTDLAGLVAGRARVQLDRITLPDSDIGNLTVAVDGTPEELRMEVRALVDEERGGEMDARIDPTPDGRSMQVDRLELQLDADEWALIQPAVLSFRDGVALREFELRAGEQAISIDGGLTAAGALDLTVAMDSTDVGTIADLVGFPRLGGWLGGRVDLTGTRDAPEGSVDLIVGYHEEGEPPTSARVLLDSDGRRVDADVTLVDPAGGMLTIAGLVPIREGEAVDLRVEATAFAIGSGVAFVDAEQLEEIAGRIDAQLSVTGPRNDLSFDGSLGLSGGRARSPLVGVTWEDIRVAARGDGRSLLIDSATMRAGSGDMSLAGSIVFADVVDLDLDAGFDEFRAIQTNAYQASISGDLHIGGSLLAPEVEGRVTTESLDVYIDERPTDGGLEDVALTAADFEILRERFGYIVVEEDVQPRTAELITADVTVEFGRDSWIRSRSTPEMAVAFAGEVEVQVRPGEEPQLQGTLTTIAGRGYIAQFGKRFAPREGTVTLAGPPAAAELDLSAAYTVPSYANPDGAEATIILGVTGTQDELSLTLSSEPPMENADIVSYIATGRPAASTFALGDADAETAESDAPGGGLAETGAGIAVGQILSSIETAAQTGVGLDVVEIRREGIRGATLAAGKYLSPRLYVGLAQPILRRERDGLSIGDQVGSEIEIEFLAFRNILLNLEGSASSLSLFLRGRVVY